MKKFLALSLAAITVVCLVACGSSGATANTEAAVSEAAQTEAPAAAAGEDSTVLLASHVFNDTHPWHLALVKLGEIISEKTDGRYTMEVYPAAALANGSSRTLIEMVGNGGTDVMIHASLSLEGFNPKYGVFGLPFLFENRDQGLKALQNSSVGEEALTWLSDYGITGVATCENGIRYFMNSKHEIQTPEDLKGLKMRVPESDVLISEFKAWGADPTPMNMTELYTALQQKTVDGCEQNVPGIDSNKLYEVAPYITTTVHCWEPAWIFFNTDLLDSLSDEDRQIFMDAAQEAAAYEVELEGEYEQSKMQTFIDAGCTITDLTSEQRQMFIDTASNVYDEFKQKIGDDLVDGILKAAEEAK